MTHTELLELAGKAIGIKKDDSPYNGGGIGNTGFDMLGNMVTDWHNGKRWNPLEDDGDALRLAVQCGIEISIVDDEPGTDGRFSRACAGYATEDDPRVRYVFEDHKGDLFAATRRAITRAAAEIGRQMEETT